MGKGGDSQGAGLSAESLNPCVLKAQYAVRGGSVVCLCLLSLGRLVMT